MVLTAKESDRLVTIVGAVVVLAVGLGLGFGAPVTNDDPAPWGRISTVIGWTYFAAWSISFYPQTYLNWKRKSVVGMSFDYQVYNLIGFGCYAAFNVSMYWDKSIKAQYAAAHGSGSSAVDLNDVFFSLHAVVLTVVQLFQISIYDRGTQTVSRLSWTLSAAFVVVTTAYAIGCAAHDAETGFLAWLSFYLYLSFVKLGISFIKYIPQVYLNFKRKSTVGWNIWNVLLDFTGGLLSVLQLFIDAGTTHDWSKVIGDPVKFGLGFLSMFFDIIFMVQHYILYTDRTDPDARKPTSASPPLLAGDQAARHGSTDRASLLPAGEAPSDAAGTV